MTVLSKARVPEKWEEARSVITDRLDELRQVADHGFESRSQYRDVRDVVVTPDNLPLDVAVRGTSCPQELRLLRAHVHPADDGSFVSGGAVLWQWVNGQVRLLGFESLDGATQYLVTLAVVD